MSTLRRRFDALITVLGFTPRGFYIPHRYASTTAKADYSELEKKFQESIPCFLDHFTFIHSFSGVLEKVNEKLEPKPRWDQDWFPRADAVLAYTMVRRFEPKRIVEIGSGHSTRFLVKAVVDGELETKIDCIDPKPRRKIDGLPGVSHIAETLQSVDSKRLLLGQGDILFVDSSHILMPGTDVDIIINKIFPQLPPGAIVHIHDIFLPDAYPKSWAWRGYNEQLAIGALLQGGEWVVEWSSHYIRTRMESEFNSSTIKKFPLVSGAFETSLWLRKIEKKQEV